MSDDRLSRLRLQLRAAAELEEPAGRALEVVAILDEAIGTEGPHPVIVGGMAVYYWTANDAFLTADIDVVVPTTEHFVETLSALGFERSRDGRHWELAGSDLLLEAPASELDQGTVVKSVQAPSGRTLGMLSHADVLLDRLAEFQSTGHEVIAQQALVLLASLSEAERSTLMRPAEARRVGHALAGLSELMDAIAFNRRRAPDSGEWHEMARAFERAEYHPKNR